MSVYDEKPWLSLYDQGQPAEIALEFTDALSMFRASVSRNPGGDIIRYFGGRITARELDELSDAFAVALAALGVRAGDRVAVYVQNVPQFVIAMLAAWKAGGIAVPVNPMHRARELDAVLRDSGARVLVCLEGLYRDVARPAAGAGLPVRALGDARDHPRRAGALDRRVAPRVRRADERAGRAARGADLADQDLVRRRSHPAQHGQGLPGPVRAVHPQHLR